MTRWQPCVLLLSVLLLPQLAPAGSGSLGVGVHYNKEVRAFDDQQWDKHGLSWLVSYQSGLASALRLELDLEIVPKSLTGGEEAAYIPQAFLLVGQELYMGLGVGSVYFNDGDVWRHDLRYDLRMGFVLPLGGPQLDVSMNYIFTEFAEIDHFKFGDTELMAILRFSL